MVTSSSNSNNYKATNPRKRSAKNDPSIDAKSRTPKRLRPSIRKDAISPGDYLKYNFPISCEECTHFNAEDTQCTIGYETQWHRREVQQKSFELSGKVALCRFMEID